jgi:peptidoglycan DL-endopeptidase RipA
VGEKRTGIRRTAGRRWLGRTVGVGLVAAVCIGAGAGAASAKPVNPSDGQITAAQQAADAATAQMGAINAQLATAQAGVERAQGEANIALDRYEAKQQEYSDAQAKAKAADDAAAKAAADLSAAQAAVADFARTSYMSGSTDSRMEGLITAGSPAQMLERAALLDAAGDHRSDVVTQVTVVRKQADVAAAGAKTALATAATLKTQAQTALANAQQLEVAARQQASTVQAQQVTLQAQLQQAQQTLVALKGERAAYQIYQQQQSAAAASAARAAAAAAAAAAPKASSSSSSGSSSSGSSSSGSSSSGSSSSGSAGSVVSGPAAGGADSSAVETAIRAAQRWIGTRYAWGGGSLTGPSEGFGIDDGVIGFDCSGLTRYAYAQAGITIPRNSSAQYAALPKVSRSNLQRGDLVFYAFDTSDPSTIHHVALYLGGGQMIEAPESGMTVRVTAMRWTGYIGAVRPSA